MDLLDLSVTINAKDNATPQIQGMSTSAVAMGTAIGGTLSGLVVSGLQAAGGAIVDFGKESLQTGMNFDSAMAQVAATMGLTKADIGALENAAKEMGATTSFSATQAAEGLNYMALAGYSSEEAIATLPTVLNLAAAGAMDLGTASDMVTDAQSALGLSLDETTTLVDQMAQTSSKSNTSVSQLGEAILQVNGTAKNLKGGITEMNATLGILADNGIKGAEGGTALRNIILSLSAPTDKAAAALNDLGIQVFDAEGNMRGLDDIMRQFDDAMGSLTQQEKTEALNTIFNKVDLKSVNALMSAATGNISAMSEAISNAGVPLGDLGEQFSITGDAAYDMAYFIDETMKNVDGSIEDTASVVAETFNMSMEDATKIVEAAADGAANATDRFSELTGQIDDAAGAAEQMAQTQLDTLAGDVTLLQSAVEGVQIELAAGATPALREMAQAGQEGLSRMANQLRSGDLTGGFVTLGETAGKVAAMFIEKIPEMADAAQKMLYGFLEGFGNAFPQIIPAIVTMITGLIEVFAQNIPLYIESGIAMINGIIQGLLKAIPVLVGEVPKIVTAIVEGLTGAIPVLINGAIELFNGIVTAIPEIVVALVEAMPQIVTAMVTGLLNAIPVLIEGAIQLFLAIVEAVPLIIETLVPMIPQIVEALATSLKEAGGQIIDAFKNIFSRMPGEAQQHLSEVLGKVGAWITEMVGKAGQVGSEFLAKVGEFFSQLPGKVGEFINQVFEDVGKWASDMANKAGEAGEEFLRNVSDEVSKLPGKFQGWIDEILGDIGQWATDMGNKAIEGGQEFLNGIGQKFGEVVTFFQGLPNRIISAIGNAGSMLFNVGRQIIQGLINGITNMINSAINAVTGALSSIVNGAKSFLGIASPSKVFKQIGDYSMQGLAKGFEDGSDAVSDTLDDILDDMANNSVTIGVKGVSGSAMATAKRDFVFNVTINAARDATDYGRKIGESLYETIQRMELSYR